MDTKMEWNKKTKLAKSITVECAESSVRIYRKL